MKSSDTEEFKPVAIERAAAGKCEGSCEEHSGRVQAFHVSLGSFDYGYFAYCEAAKAEDKRRGLQLDPVQAEVKP